MAKPWAKSFYNSTQWKDCRKAYIESRVFIDGGLCEHCHDRVGYIVDHKVEMTPETIQDPWIALNHANFQYLCTECHNTKTFGNSSFTDGISFDEQGNIIMKKNVYIVWGSPGSGKTTYVKENMGTYDIVVDLDDLRSALSLADHKTRIIDTLPFAIEIRDLMYALIADKRYPYDTAWVIATLPSKSKREELSKRLNAELIHISTSKEECLRRIAKDTERADKALHQRIIEKYFDELEL